MFTPGIMAQRRRVSPGGGGFSPADLPGIAAWYDASNAASITLSGSLVTRWDSLVGGRYAIPNSPGLTEFTRSVAAVNGLTALVASGNGAMAFDSLLSLPNGGSYAFIIGGNADTSTGTVFLPGTNSTRYMLDLESAGLMYAASTAAGSYIVNGIGAATSDGSINLFGVSMDAGGWKADFNSLTSSGPQTDGVDIIGLANYQASSFRLHGTICEVVIGTSAITSTQRAQLLAYLKAKWATP